MINATFASAHAIIATLSAITLPFSNAASVNP